MAVDILLEVDGIDGESRVSGFEKKIDVLSWSWGASQSGTTHMGPGGGAGKVSVQDISVMKYVDSASHALWLACCKGKHIAKAKLTCRKAGGDAVNYLVIEMEEIIVANISTSSSMGDDRQTEGVTFNFAKFKYNYSPQKADGTADAAKTMGWDIAQGAEY
jgi:type VI secretion system secreted protein Hcp